MSNLINKLRFWWICNRARKHGWIYDPNPKPMKEPSIKWKTLILREKDT